jgi:plasmid stabilization system protein ParE
MTKPLRIVFQPRAEADALKIDAWWRLNRPAAPDLFLEELEQTTDALSRSPGIGMTASARGLPGARRLHMRRTRFHLYYRVVEDTLEILAVWHTARRTGPR